VFRNFRVVAVSVLSLLPEHLFLRAFDGATQQNGALNSGSAADSVFWDVTLHRWVCAFRRLEGL
jgi:hypothetical protein